LLRDLFPRRFVATPALVLALLLGLSGCANREPMGEVSGKVTFEGKVVGEGLVHFKDPKTGASEEALLNTDGTFALKAPLPLGQYKVLVMPLIDREQVDGKGPVVGVERPAPNIPDRYRTDSSDLKVTVVEGKNEVSLDMKR